VKCRFNPSRVVQPVCTNAQYAPGHAITRYKRIQGNRSFCRSHRFALYSPTIQQASRAGQGSVCPYRGNPDYGNPNYANPNNTQNNDQYSDQNYNQDYNSPAYTDPGYDNPWAASLRLRLLSICRIRMGSVWLLWCELVLRWRLYRCWAVVSGIWWLLWAWRLRLRSGLRWTGLSRSGVQRAWTGRRRLPWR